MFCPHSGMTSSAVILTSGLRAGSQQVDHVQVMADVDQNLQF